MCGIVGVLGKIGKSRLSMFEDMLTMDAVRGNDSTGVAVINKEDVWWGKDVVLPNGIFDWQDYKDAKKAKPFCLIGHNRAATRGAIKSDNAHPFQHGHITLVHNGTLDAAWRLPNYWKFGTDSEAIAYAISQHGIETVWPVIDGAATLVFWDDKEKSLNVISNNKRPFFMQPFPGSTGIVWSSERWTLLTAAARTGVVLDKTEEIFTTKSDVLYTFLYDPDTDKLKYREKKLEPYKVGNSIPGYQAHVPASYKKKKKKRAKSATADIIPFKSARASAEVFGSAECFAEWQQRQLDKVQPKDNGTDADLDTRAVPFRGPYKQTEKPTRTAEEFFRLFDLTELNPKSCTPEWFMAAYPNCFGCDGSMDYSDYFTAKIMSSTAALCSDCQCDIWVTSGIDPNNIRQH